MIIKEAIISNTLETEGYYVNDPSDSGGETYCGIARNSNPKWQGWKIVDKHKLNTGRRDGEREEKVKKRKGGGAQHI